MGDLRSTASQRNTLRALHIAAPDKDAGAEDLENVGAAPDTPGPDSELDEEDLEQAHAPVEPKSTQSQAQVSGSAGIVSPAVRRTAGIVSPAVRRSTRTDLQSDQPSAHGVREFHCPHLPKSLSDHYLRPHLPPQPLVLWSVQHRMFPTTLRTSFVPLLSFVFKAKSATLRTGISKG